MNIVIILVVIGAAEEAAPFIIAAAGAAVEEHEVVLGLQILVAGQALALVVQDGTAGMVVSPFSSTKATV